MHDRYGDSLTGRIDYTVHTNAVIDGTAVQLLHVLFEVRDHRQRVVASGTTNRTDTYTDALVLTGTVHIPHVRLWWPRWMVATTQPGYLYTTQFTLYGCKASFHVACADGFEMDVYEQPVGVRTLDWADKELMINGRRVYMRGVGRLEDSDVGRTVWHERLSDASYF